MNTTDLSRLLHDAADGLEPRPDFTRQVLAGGRRHRLRRRLTVVASAVAVIAVAVSGTVVALDHEPRADVANELLTRPTKGGLAGDRAFLAQVLGVWESDLTYMDEARFRLYDDLRGAPHVMWAGDTAAGPVAVVIQQTYVHQDYWVHAQYAGLRTVTGLVATDPTDGKLRLVATRSPIDNASDVPTCFRFGQYNRLALVVDEGKPLYLSTSVSPGSAPVSTGPNDSRTRLQWRRIQARDGVAMLSTDDVAAGPLATYQGDHPPEVVDMARRSSGIADAEIGLGHRQVDPHFRLPIPNFFPWKNRWTIGTPVAGVDTKELERTARPASRWQITVWSPDRVILVRENMIIDNKSKSPPQGAVLTVETYELVGNQLGPSNVEDVGVVDHDAVLPIRYRIPDGGGWIVARKDGSLAYRTTRDGQWRDAGEDAALLPDDAVQVKVGEDVVSL
ncbi:hypothetical protein [Actinophytocola sp.]|uniref:hypothetical protein n=1 Tax=Actinophytocola sp. TaxID=1872138 RepID=UPI00389A33E2